MFIAKESCVLGRWKQGFCVAYCRYWSWPTILCISLVHPGAKLHCCLKNNRQPWECTEMKGQDKACQEITFSSNYKKKKELNSLKQSFLLTLLCFPFFWVSLCPTQNNKKTQIEMNLNKISFLVKKTINSCRCHLHGRRDFGCQCHLKVCTVWMAVGMQLLWGSQWDIEVRNIEKLNLRHRAAVWATTAVTSPVTLF